jgi:hypothetical protein
MEREEKYTEKICIPFALPKLREIIPGIMTGTYYSTSAGTGIGKTQLTKFLFIRKAIEYAEKHGINYKILFFAREESEEDFWDSFRLMLIKERHQISLDLYGLQGYRGAVDDKIKALVAEIEPEINLLKKYIEVIDTVGNPTGIYKHIKKVSNERGKHLYINNKTHEIVEEHELLDTDDLYRYYKYVPHDPRELVLVIVDHVSLLSTEKGATTLHESMQKMSAEYFLDRVIKRFKYAVVSIHQQTMAGEGLEYYKTGLHKLFPTMDKLGDNKLIGRDYQIVLGLFNPNNHKELAKKSDIGYNLDILQDNMRTLHILKHRKGKLGDPLALFFDGGSQKFVELPPPGSKELNEVYSIIQEKRSRGLL